MSLRRARWPLLGFSLVVLIGFSWLAWQVWQVGRDLDRAVEHADAFQSAVERGDQAAIDRELAALRGVSSAAADRTSGPSWSLLTQLPAFGDDAEGVRAVSQVVDDLAQDALESLVEVEDALDDLLPRGGAVPVAVVRQLQEPVERAKEELVAADVALAQEDPSGYVGRLRDQYRDLQARISDARHAVEAAAIATEIAPAMLGEDEERTYLLVFQNNSEIRATGGLPGVATLVTARNGELRRGQQAEGAEFGRAEDLPLPLTQPERRLFDDVLGAYFLSSNMTPDIPRAAELWAARWEQVSPADEIDGVVTLDTVAVSYLLEATGPIDVEGIQLTGDNLVEELLHNVYVRWEDPARQDKFFAEVVRQTFDRFINGTSNPSGVVEALARATGEGRLAMHSFDPTEQAAIAGTTIAGELVTDAAVPAPQIDVTINDTTGGKMSYFLRYDVDISATYCSGGIQGFRAKASMWSEAPADAAELPDSVTGGGEFDTKPGNELVTVRIYGPAAGTVDDLVLNGQPLDPITVDQGSRPVNMFYLELTPGQVYDLAWSMKGGAGQTLDPRVRITPSIVSGAAEPVVGAC